MAYQIKDICMACSSAFSRLPRKSSGCSQVDQRSSYTKIVSMSSHKGLYTYFLLCCVIVMLTAFTTSWRFSSRHHDAFRHWYWMNNAIAVPVKQSWRLSMDKWHGFTAHFYMSKKNAKTQTYSFCMHAIWVFQFIRMILNDTKSGHHRKQFRDSLAIKYNGKVTINLVKLNPL